MWCILFLSSLLPFTNSCWTPSFSFSIYRVCLYRFWGERFDLHIVKVYSSVLLVYANLIFALLKCQSYKSYLVHRISILYHGDDNVDCNIFVSWIGAYYTHVYISVVHVPKNHTYMHTFFFWCFFGLRD